LPAGLTASGFRSQDDSDQAGAARQEQPGRAVSVVITEPTSRLFGDPFFAPLLKGIYDALAERSILLVALGLRATKDLDLVETYLSGRNVDGVILVSLHGDSPLPAKLVALGIPAVICGRAPKDVRISFVDSDNRQGAALAVNHLISLGRRHVAMISGNLDMPAAVDRVLGYREALAFAGIPSDPTMEEVADFVLDRARVATERLLENHPEINGIFAASDLMAVGALEVVHATGRKVPEDVAIIGFDDTTLAKSTTPPLSSIRQPIEEMGREAVSVLVREMDEPGELPRQVVFATELVARESTVASAPRRRRRR
jgi:DNA-binding LacI/PurR family transcriptional regulator